MGSRHRGVWPPPLKLGFLPHVGEAWHPNLVQITPFLLQQSSLDVARLPYGWGHVPQPARYMCMPWARALAMTRHPCPHPHPPRPQARGCLPMVRGDLPIRFGAMGRRARGAKGCQFMHVHASSARSTLVEGPSLQIWLDKGPTHPNSNPLTRVDRGWPGLAK